MSNELSQVASAPYADGFEADARPTLDASCSQELTRGRADGRFEAAAPAHGAVVGDVVSPSTALVKRGPSDGIGAPARRWSATVGGHAPFGGRMGELLRSRLPARRTVSPRSVLLCPGPVLLSPHVLRAVTRTNICHREPEFSKLLLESEAMLKPVVGIDSANRSYRIVFLTGSGTAANEAVLAGIGASGPTLVVTNGDFGERLLATTRRYNRDVVELRFPWRQAVDLEKVEDELQRRQYHLVVVVHHETSTGMLNPIAAIARLAHRHGALIAVDAISSIGAEVIAAEEWGLDVLTGTSGKALSAMPGVGIVIVKDSVLEESASMPASSQYLNLHRHYHYMRDHAQTPNTPAVHVLVSLHASLEEITLLGLKRVRGVIGSRALFARERLTQMGLEYADYRGMNSNVVTCVWLPPSLPFEHLARHLKTKGIVVYNGKGALTNRIFQIGHIGALRKNDTRDALRQVQAVLRQGHRATVRPLEVVPAELTLRASS